MPASFMIGAGGKMHEGGNEARALYESVLRADPGFQPARQHIFRLGAKDGRLLLLPVQPGIPR